MSNDRLSSVIEALYQELKCSVCFSMFSEPHSLPCLHIFCKTCIDRCLTIRPNCPLCNANFHRRQVDPCGVISSVIDVYKKLYMALSAVVDVPCLSQALSQLPTSKRKSPDTIRNAPSLDKIAKSPCSLSSTQLTTLDCETQQEIIPAIPNDSNAAQNPHLQTPTPVEFRTLTTPIRSRRGYSRSPADEACIEPWSPFESSMLKMAVSRCSICFESDSRPLLLCSRCNVAVHFVCYGISPDIISTEWLCAPCESGISTTPQCVLCPNTDDRAFRPCSRELNAWVHVSCALWAPQPRFSETSFGNGGLVDDVTKVPAASKKLRCVICRKRGFCLQCEYGRCLTAFHVPCAARSKVRLELRGLRDKVYFHQLCPSHSHLSNEVPTDNTAGSEFSRRTQRRTSFSPSPTPKRRHMLSTSRSSSRHSGRFVLLLTGFQLTDKMSRLFRSKGVDVIMNLSNSVTHVVTKCHSSGPQAGKAIARTVKYMFGIAKGAWCVSQHWIHDWVKFGNAPDELNYEVLGDYAATGAPRRSRVSNQQGKSPLFGGIDFIISGPFTKNIGLHIELAEIINAAGGSTSNSVPDRQPLRPTVLIQEPIGNDEDESERREYASIRQQCLAIGIAIYDVQWLFNLLSYFTSPLTANS